MWKDFSVCMITHAHQITHTRWINQAAMQWMTWIYISSFFPKSTENIIFPLKICPPQPLNHWKSISYSLSDRAGAIYSYTFIRFLFPTTAGVNLMLSIFFFNHCTEIFVWKYVQWEIRCFTAITANKIISTSGRTQYCTNTTPSHPQYDGVTTQILSVNMNWTTKSSTIHAWRASYSSRHHPMHTNSDLYRWIWRFQHCRIKNGALYLTQANKKNIIFFQYQFQNRLQQSSAWLYITIKTSQYQCCLSANNTVGHVLAPHCKPPN